MRCIALTMSFAVVFVSRSPERAAVRHLRRRADALGADDLDCRTG
ncbi:MAG: hypothetical protein ACLFPO_09080 [Spirochaetaceae bacterium]